MKNLLHKLRESMTPRQRTAVIVLAVAAITLLYGWLLHSIGQARARLQASVMTLQAQAARLEQQSVEYARLRTVPVPSTANTDLRTLIESLAESSGLARSMVKLDALDGNRVQLVFGAVSFADWLQWIRTLQAQQARIEGCRIEALSTPGLVSITATLVRVPPQ